MPPPSKVFLLPTEILDQLNARLRSNGYAELEQLSAWLAANGHRIGKSALGEYSIKLREADARGGDLRAVLRSRPPKRKVEDELPTTVEDVLMELGRLRVRERALLALLDQLSVHPK